ncbi:MAG TPA: HEAT repeat domain-containing protein [Actinomycetota bacterium]|nr:HEAT repeat domain-containing protein [Actinomycetota bacterium]
MGDERARGIDTLLKQLWLGLSAYRLFPGSVEHEGFVAAVERIDSSARAALASGPVDVEVRGDRFLWEGVELEDDPHLHKLALVLFERRIERVTVVATPDVHDLDRLYALLSRDADDLDAEGGAGPVLRAQGVGSVELSRVGPAPVEGADHAAADVEPVTGGTPAALVEPLTPELMLEDLRGAPADQAETLLIRLREMLDDPSLATGGAIEAHASVHGFVGELPPDIRRALVELLVDRVRVDPVAERLLSTMSNAELTRALVDLGREGRRDPTELALELSRAGVRPLEIVDLTAALASGREEAGTIIAGLEQLGIDSTAVDEAGPASSVTEAIADYLGATESDDARAIQAALAHGEDQRRAEAISALGDYLTLEADLDRTGAVLDLWAGELREALRARDVPTVGSLATAVHEALPESAEARRELFDAYVRHALQPELVTDLVETDADEGVSVVADLLEPFGDLGVEILLDLLADEEDRARRARLLGVARRTVRDRVTRVTPRLADPRWYVVRNAVILLGASGRPEVLPQIESQVLHAAPAVRHEVATALVGAGGVEAVPALGRLAVGPDREVRVQAVAALATLVGPEATDGLVEVVQSSDDHALRLRALEELARRPDGAERLGELASRASRPRLPWGLRRRARSLARARGTT